MKALSVRQPWANLIADGVKTIETRTWNSNYRGDILILSSKSPKIEPAGYALVVVKMVDCRPMTVKDEEAACCDLYEGAYSWVLTDIRKIVPFPITGKLGLFNCDIEMSDLKFEKKSRF